MSKAHSDLEAGIEQSINLSNFWLNIVENLLKMFRLMLDILDTFLSDGRLFLIGNGESAAEGIHVAAEFVGKCRLDYNPFPAICQHDLISSVADGANIDFIRVGRDSVSTSKENQMPKEIISSLSERFQVL